MASYQFTASTMVFTHNHYARSIANCVNNAALFSLSLSLRHSSVSTGEQPSRIKRLVVAGNRQCFVCTHELIGREADTNSLIYRHRQPIPTTQSAVWQPVANILCHFH